MKKIISIILIIVSNSTLAQNCNIGNEDTVGFSNSADPIYKNYLLGVKFNLSTNGMLTSLNLVGRNTGAKVQLAVYKDNAGVPGDLIVSSNDSTVGTGVISLPVPPTQLIPGDYWIMGVYDKDGGHTYGKVSTGNVVYYDTVIYGSPLPSNASNFLSYTGIDLTYFMEITCYPLEILGTYNLSNISFYPNPVNDLITISSDKYLIGSTYEIFDLTGRLMLAGKFYNQTSQIDLSQLKTGVYLLQVGQNRSLKIKLSKK